MINARPDGSPDGLPDTLPWPPRPLMGSPGAAIDGALANERLVLSREHMRRFLHGEEPASPTAANAGWLNAGRVAAQAARLALAPVAERHPLALAGTAVLAGALLGWTRPWRWLLRPVVFAGIAAQLTSRVIARVPVERVADAVIALLTPKPARAAPAPHER